MPQESPLAGDLARDRRPRERRERERPSAALVFSTGLKTQCPCSPTRHPMYLLLNMNQRVLRSEAKV